MKYMELLDAPEKNVKPGELAKNSKLQLQHKAPAMYSNVSDVLVIP